MYRTYFSISYVIVFFVNRDDEKTNRTTGGDEFSVSVEYLGFKDKYLDLDKKELIKKWDSTTKSRVGCYSIIKREENVNIEDKNSEQVLLPGIKIQDLNNGR